MDYPCTDCGASVEMPNDALPGEIIGCPDCGLDYVIETDEGGEGEQSPAVSFKKLGSALDIELEEGTEEELAEKITRKLRMPTIGIGAGSHCDGQVLVTYDAIGYFDKFVPKFVKKYTEVSKTIGEAISSFKRETESGAFPDDEHSFL